MKRPGSDEALRCSFCHKSQDVVGKLISSPSDYPRAYICDECIAVCNSILEDDQPEGTAGQPASGSRVAEFSDGRAMKARIVELEAEVTRLRNLIESKPENG